METIMATTYKFSFVPGMATKIARPEKITEEQLKEIIEACSGEIQYLNEIRLDHAL